MAWTNLPTDYEDAQWNGLRKYEQVDNDDGTVSFRDVTAYSKKEKSFFGADDANKMNAAMNQLAGNIDTATAKAKEATTAATTATNKAKEASNSATSASQSASAATQKASDASASATSASKSATTATTKASEASNSATSASTSAKAADASATKVAALLFSNAGAHNAIYRGKALGSTVTAAQYAAIKAGTFDDLYIGDYWTIGEVNYRIAAFDYFLNCGDQNCTTHHVVIVPDAPLYRAQMHNTDSGKYEGGEANTTAGGYVGSDMYKTNLEKAKTTIKGAFSGHVLKHRIYLTNAVANGRASGGAWCDSEVDLMCEQMVYGTGIFSPVSDGRSVPTNYRVEKSQLPLFQYNHSLIGIRTDWWLRDVITAAHFALVSYGGGASYFGASAPLGVRPYFLLS